MQRRRVFKGKLLNLYLERRRLPNGFIALLEVIKHPGAVLIVPFLSRDKIILIRQYRPIINSYIWELPAGTLHLGENHNECAKRELAEEIGYKANRLKRIGYIYPACGYTTEKIIIYEARKLDKIDVRGEEDEIIFSKSLSRNAIRKLLRSGKIVDAKTICALTLTGIV